MQLGMAAAVAQIVASLGMIVTLFYLALQIRQNTRATRAATYQSVTTHITSANALIAGSPDLAALVDKAAEGLSGLSLVERTRFDGVASGYFRHYDAVYYHFRIGALEREQWEGFERYLRLGLAWPGVSAWWSENRAYFSSHFVSLVDGLIERTSAVGGQDAA
jgi:hypothetical protein